MTPLSPTWPVRGVRFVLCSILLNAVLCWGLGIAHYIGIFRTPLWPYDSSYYPDRGSVYGFACALPMITAFLTAFELVAHRFYRLYPLASLIWSIVSIIGWAFMFEEWFACELGMDAGTGAFCPSGFGLKIDPSAYAGYSPAGSGRKLWIVRSTFAMVMVILYLAYMIVASIALDRNRKAAKTSLRGSNSKELDEVKRVSGESV